jgi:hypothetical protein
MNKDGNHRYSFALVQPTLESVSYAMAWWTLSNVHPHIYAMA